MYIFLKKELNLFGVIFFLSVFWALLCWASHINHYKKAISRLKMSGIEVKLYEPTFINYSSLGCLFKAKNLLIDSSIVKDDETTSLYDRLEDLLLSFFMKYRGCNHPLKHLILDKLTYALRNRKGLMPIPKCRIERHRNHLLGKSICLFNKL